MKRVIIPASLAAVVLAALALSVFPQFVTGAEEEMMAMPFGGNSIIRSRIPLSLILPRWR